MKRKNGRIDPLPLKTTIPGKAESFQIVGLGRDFLSLTYTITSLCYRDFLSQFPFTDNSGSTIAHY